MLEQTPSSPDNGNGQSYASRGYRTVKLSDAAGPDVTAVYELVVRRTDGLERAVSRLEGITVSGLFGLLVLAVVNLFA